MTVDRQCMRHTFIGTEPFGPRASAAQVVRQSVEQCLQPKTARRKEAHLQGCLAHQKGFWAVSPALKRSIQFLQQSSIQAAATVCPDSCKSLLPAQALLGYRYSLCGQHTLVFCQTTCTGFYKPLSYLSKKSASNWASPCPLT